MKYDQIAEAYMRMYSLDKDYQSEDILMEDRIDYLKQNIGVLDTSHDSSAFHHDTGSIIDHFANNADPSINKVHTQYILNLYKKKAIRQEDAPHIHQALSNFDRYKALLDPDDRILNHKNYPTIQHLTDKIAPHIGAAVTNKEKVSRLKDYFDQTSHRKIFDNTDKGGNLRVYRLASDESGVEAAKVFYGRKGLVKPTDCCHAWGTPKSINLGYTDNRDNRLFDYVKTDYPGTNIYMLHNVDPSGNVKNVLSWHAASLQLKDEENNDVDHLEFFKMFPNKQFDHAINQNHEMVRVGPTFDPSKI